MSLGTVKEFIRDKRTGLLIPKPLKAKSRRRSQRNRDSKGRFTSKPASKLITSPHVTHIPCGRRRGNR